MAFFFYIFCISDLELTKWKFSLGVKKNLIYLLIHFFRPEKNRLLFFYWYYCEKLNFLRGICEIYLLWFAVTNTGVIVLTFIQPAQNLDFIWPKLCFKLCFSVLLKQAAYSVSYKNFIVFIYDQ